LKDHAHYKEIIDKFLVTCPNERPHEYLYKDCRVAIAHAGKDANSDPDDVGELVRLHEAAEILHMLARHFISTELRVPDSPYSED
jgi:Methylamine utilization protein MauJ